MVHRVEDILMHRMDLKMLFFAEGMENIGEFRECDRQMLDVGKHDHGKIVLNDALGDVKDIGVIGGAHGRNLCDDADRVFTDSPLADIP